MSASSDLTLVVGATGYLGSLVSHQLLASGQRVRCLTRPSSAEKVEKLKANGAEVAFGDLTDSASLSAALVGVTKLVITASAVLTHASVEAVDRIATLHLIDLAVASGSVKHIVYISFPPQPIDFPLQTAKREVEAKIVRSAGEGAFSYTILQPTYFSEIWFSPVLGLDLAGKKAKFFGTGEGGKTWYVSIVDVAKATVSSLDTNNRETLNKIIPFGGPEGLTQKEVIERVEKKKGIQLDVTAIPADVFRAQLSDPAKSEIEKVFAGLMLMLEDHPYDLSSCTPEVGERIFHFSPSSIDAYIDTL